LELIGLTYADIAKRPGGFTGQVQIVADFRNGSIGNLEVVEKKQLRDTQEAPPLNFGQSG
jgi:hypothetical protein